MEDENLTRFKKGCQALEGSMREMDDTPVCVITPSKLDRILKRMEK